VKKLEQKVKDCYEKRPFPNLIQNSTDKDKVLSDITSWLKINLKYLSSGLPEFKPRNILVAGCGTAEEVIALTRIFSDSEIVALDMCEASLKIAQQNLDAFSVEKVTLKQMSILKDLPKYDASFDLVFCSGVIHHLEEPETGFKILSTKVAQNGILIINLYHSYGLFMYKLRYSFINWVAGTDFDKRIRLAKMLKLHNREADKDETFLFDSYINPQVKTFTIGQVNKWAELNLPLSGVSPPLSIGGLVKFGLEAKSYVTRRKSIIKWISYFLATTQGKGIALHDVQFRYQPVKVFFYELIFLILGKGECWYYLQQKPTNNQREQN
jgi:SAM-dependent methyltransferase